MLIFLWQPHFAWDVSLPGVHTLLCRDTQTSFKFFKSSGTVFISATLKSSASHLIGVWVLPNTPSPQLCTSVDVPVDGASVLWKLCQISLSLSEFPAEVDNQLQQQHTDRQEKQQAEEPERKKAACLSVRLRDGLSKNQSQISPGATQHLHTAQFSGTPQGLNGCRSIALKNYQWANTYLSWQWSLMM